MAKSKVLDIEVLLDGMQKISLYGWIKNRDKGYVEVMIQGTLNELRACIEIFNQESIPAHVESLSVDWKTLKKLHDEFKVMV